MVFDNDNEHEINLLVWQKKEKNFENEKLLTRKTKMPTTTCTLTCIHLVLFDKVPFYNAKKKKPYFTPTK